MKIRVMRFFHTITFLCILCVLLSISRFYLYDDNTYTRVMFHEMYNSEQIDMVFIGSSNVYRHFSPEVWDKYVGLHTFSLGTASQTPDGAYYVLNELFKTQSPKYCIYGVNFILFLNLEAYTEPKKDYIVFDYLKPSCNKWIYGFNVFHDKSLLQALVPATRNANNDLIKTIEEIIDIKTTENYRKYGYEIYPTSGTEEYRGRGFVYSYKQIIKGEVGKVEPHIFNEYEISEQYISYMKKVKSLCDENGCELIFVIPPLPYASMAAQDDYQEILDFYDEIATILGVPIFNFDLSKPEYLFMNDDDFSDSAHMNGKGAENFSNAASKLAKRYIEGEEISKDKYFYTSYEELLEHSPWIFNTWLEKTEKGYIAYASYGKGVVPEYCFQWSDDNGTTWHLLQEYSENNQILRDTIPDQCNMLMVWAKPKGAFIGDKNFQQCDRMVLE